MQVVQLAIGVLWCVATPIPEVQPMAFEAMPIIVKKIKQMFEGYSEGMIFNWLPLLLQA